MYIQKSGKKYRLVERYKDPLTGRLKRITIGLKDKKKSTIKEASIVLTNKINKLLSEAGNGKIIHGVTLESLLDEFMAVAKQKYRRTTYYNYKGMQKTIIAELGADVLVENLTPRIISGFLENLMYGDRGISGAYASKYKYYFHEVMAFAVKRSYIKKNPVDEITVDYKSPVSSKIEDKFFEQFELEEFLKYAYAHNTNYAQLCEWLYLTGSRIGEATSLDFKDVYRKGNYWVVNIEGTLDYDHVKISEQKKSDATKTVKSTREVVLPKKAMAIYRKRVEITGGHGFIFCTSHGTPIQTSAVNTFLRTAKKRLKIDKPISSHIFRHTHISKLAELGVPLYVIQKRVGHADSKITRDIYLHVTQKVIEKEAPKLDKL